MPGQTIPPQPGLGPLPAQGQDGLASVQPGENHDFLTSTGELENFTLTNIVIKRIILENFIIYLNFSVTNIDFYFYQMFMFSK